ncbi:MAG: hypothetical protein QW520_02085 [Methanomassiliicoccales archaeon]
MSARNNPQRVLELKQTRPMARQYVLLEEGLEVGWLQFLKAFGSLAEMGSKGKSFTLKRVGFLRPMVTVRKKDLEEDIAYVKFERSWGVKCTLELLNGGTIEMRGPTLRDSNWTFYQSDGDLMVFSYKQKLLCVEGTCQILKESAWIDPIMLSLIGWYLIILILMEKVS